MPGINADKNNLVLGPAEVSLFLTFQAKVHPTISSKTSGYYVPLATDFIQAETTPTLPLPTKVVQHSKNDIITTR